MGNRLQVGKRSVCNQLFRSTQPSTLCGTVKWAPDFSGCTWRQPTGGLASQVGWDGLRIGGRLVLILQTLSSFSHVSATLYHKKC